jgi:hypothetical protein
LNARTLRLLCGLLLLAEDRHNETQRRTCDEREMSHRRRAT